MIRRCAPGLAALALAGCSAAPPTAAPPPLRGVVSLDYCADQMVLGLVPKDNIRAVSPEADTDVAFSAPRALGIPRVRPSLEEIAALRPRYAVRSYGGSPGIDRQLRALGITVVQLGAISRLDEVPAELRRVGTALQAYPRAKLLADGFSRAVADSRQHGGRVRPTLLYMTPGDVTTGRDSFVGDIITTAGFQSVRTAPGWGSIPLEAMVRRPPDAVLRAFFDNTRHRQDRWSSSLHPRLQQITAATPVIDVRGSSLACGNWLAGDALRHLAQLRRNLSQTS